MNLRIPVDMLRWLFVIVNVVLLASAGLTAGQFFTERPKEELSIVLAETEKFVVPEEIRRTVDRQTQGIVNWITRTKPVPPPLRVKEEGPKEVGPPAEGGPLAAANWIIDGMLQASARTSYAYLRKDAGEAESASPRPARRNTRRRNTRRITPRVGATGGPTTTVTARSGRSFFIDETEYFCDLVDAQSGTVYYRTTVDSQQYVLKRDVPDSSLLVENGVRQLTGGEPEESDNPNAPAGVATPPSRQGSFEQRKNAPKVSNENAARARQRQQKTSPTVERNRAQRQAAARRALERQRKSVTPEAKAALERIKESGVTGEKLERLKERIESGEEVPELSKEFRESKEGQKQAERDGSNEDAERASNRKKRGGGR